MMVLLVLLSLFVHTIHCDKVADILFTSNIEELHNEPIHFDKPLPKWLKGTMVSE